MLSVLHGPFHPELEEAFLAQLRELKRGRPLAPVTVVTPSRRLSRHLAARVAEAFPAGFAAIRFHNLFSFARAIWDERPEPDVHFVWDALLLERVLIDLIQREFAGRPYLARALRMPGTARAILGAIKELRDAAVDPADALEAMKEGVLTGGEESVKLSELLSLHYHYSKELRKRKWRDRADIVVRATEIAAESPLLASQAGILYYGFYELVQTQLDLFKAVSAKFPVTAFYPYEDEPEYAFSRDFFQNVLGGEKRALPSDAPPLRGRVISASGMRDEVWGAAKEILRLRDEGIPFEEIGVVARTLDPYVELVESVFRQNCIPFTSSARRKLSLARELTLLSLADEDFPRDKVVDVFEGPDVPLWDLVTRALGIAGGRDEWEKRLLPWDRREFVVEQRGHPELRTLRVPAEKMSELVDVVRRLLADATGPESGSWKEHAAWARRLIGDRPELQQFAALDGVVAAPTGKDFREALREHLRDAKRPAGVENIRGVQVLDAMAARGLGFRAVVILGMNDRVWPRFILEDPFIPEGARQQMRFRLGNYLPLKLAGYDEEKLLFTMVTGAARDELVLFWQRSDAKGRVQVRSPFIEGWQSRSIPRRPLLKLKECRLEGLTLKEASVRSILLSPQARDRGLAAVGAFGWDAEAYRASSAYLRAIEVERAPGVRDGVVGALEPYWRALTQRGISPTSLETFSECPFRYYAQKVLELDPLEEPEAEMELSARETGTFYHLFLERFYRNYQGRPLPETLEAARDAFERTFRETCRDHEAKRTFRYAVLWEVERERLRGVLEAYVSHDLANREAFVPAFLEEPVEGTLDVPLGRHAGVRFMGYVDRLDVHPSGAFRVLDYKRAGTERYKWSMEKGILDSARYFQPPIYFLLAERLLRSKDMHPVRDASSSGYVFLEDLARGEGRTELWLKGSFWEREAEFARLLERHLDAIADGVFHIREGDHCRNCEFSVACRRKHQPTRWRALRAARKDEKA